MDLNERLSRSVDGERLRLLGVRADDVAPLREAVEAALADAEERTRVAELAARLAARVGAVPGLADPTTSPTQVFEDVDAEHPRGRGVRPLLALLATVDDVRADHAARGVDDAVSWRTLSDLGQQMWVNRLTYGGFGLHTHRWLTQAWSGSLFWLGRLQLGLTRVEVEPHRGTLALSAHIPQTGPLTPERVDDSLERAEDFFAVHFPQARPAWFHCESWLLDPSLAAGLPGSNIAAFQARWELFGAPQPGTADAVFFTFRRRGPVEADDLTANSRLEALVTDHVRSGEPLHVRHGRIPFTAALAHATR